MSPSDRPPVSQPPAAQRQDGTAPRSAAQRLLMLLTLIGLCLLVTIPTLITTGLFGQRPKPNPTPEPGGTLRAVLQKNADTLLPPPPPLDAGTLTVTVRPEHVAARAEKVRRQAARFGGTATDGLPGDKNTAHLFVDLPAAQTAAFRQAVTANDSAESSAPKPAAVAGSLDHIEVFIRPTADDE